MKRLIEENWWVVLILTSAIFLTVLITTIYLANPEGKSYCEVPEGILIPQDCQSLPRIYFSGNVTEVCFDCENGWEFCRPVEQSDLIKNTTEYFSMDVPK
jgi:hypothetical protein